MLILQENSIQISKCWRQEDDGAANMSGVNSEVQTKIKSSQSYAEYIQNLNPVLQNASNRLENIMK